MCTISFQSNRWKYFSKSWYLTRWSGFRKHDLRVSRSFLQPFDIVLLRHDEKQMTFNLFTPQDLHLLITLQYYTCFKAVSGLGEHNIQQSAEYRLRVALFNGYDRMVRPVLQPSDVMNVTFLVEFNALSEVVSCSLFIINLGSRICSFGQHQEPLDSIYSNCQLH